MPPDTPVGSQPALEISDGTITVDSPNNTFSEGLRRSGEGRAKFGEFRRKVRQNCGEGLRANTQTWEEDERVVKRSDDDLVLEGGHLSSLGLQNSEQEEFLSCQI